MNTNSIRPARKVKRASPIWNILTILVLLAICGVVYYFYTIFINPTSFLNPFPPVLLPTKFSTATPTATYKPLEPTWTPTATIQPSPSRTKAPTWTLIPTRTTIGALGSETETATVNAMPASAEVTYAASTTVHPDLGCKWFGVGGKVVDPDGNPVAFQTVQLSGSLNGKPLNMMVLSGHDNVPAYGPSGFEFALGTTPIASTQTLWIMLFDNTGKALTNKTFLDTFTDCDKNLVMVVFTKLP